jgi:hypothetical protein
MKWHVQVCLEIKMIFFKKNHDMAGNLELDDTGVSRDGSGGARGKN